MHVKRFIPTNERHYGSWTDQTCVEFASWTDTVHCLLHTTMSHLPSPPFYFSFLSSVHEGLVLAEGVGRKEEGRPRSWLPQCSLEADLLSDSGHVQSRHQLYLASRGEHGLARRRPSRGDMREHASAPPSLGSRCLASRSPWWPQHRRWRMLNLLRPGKGTMVASAFRVRSTSTRSSRTGGGAASLGVLVAHVALTSAPLSPRLSVVCATEEISVGITTHPKRTRGGILVGGATQTNGFIRLI
jgi:hypothetical protein